jgi:uncharacterized membrane protein YfcA
VSDVLAVLVCLAGGLAGGLVGVGGGILFVPALTVFIGLGQVEGEATSLLMIVIVALREALIIGALSPLGVLAGVAASNLLPQRALQLAFAALALFMAAHLVRRARAA